MVPLLTVVLLGLCSHVALAGVGRVDAPCTACKAISHQLQTRLDMEKPRNHLDMRHRLDSQGQRYGKMIEYRLSELRAYELLEGLCKTANKYTLVTVTTDESGSSKRRKHWCRTDKIPVNATRPAKHEEEVRQKQLENYCGRVLEEHEDDLTSALQKGTLSEKGVAQYLCGDLLKTCPYLSTEASKAEAVAAAAAEGAAAAGGQDATAADSASSDSADPMAAVNALAEAVKVERERDFAADDAVAPDDGTADRDQEREHVEL